MSAATVAVLDKASHTYKLNGEELRFSVSEVLKLSGIVGEYPASAMFAVEHARELGEVTHEWCEYLDVRGVSGEIDWQRVIQDLDGEEPGPFVRAYQRFLEKYRVKWDFIERSFCREDVGGTPDRIGIVDGEMTILDIKTSKQNAKHWQLQLTGYQWITKLPLEVRLKVLWLHDDATFNVLEYEPDFETWGAALQVARWKKK
jgi:hypothetical protein